MYVSLALSLAETPWTEALLNGLAAPADVKLHHEYAPRKMD
jgi:hypothetical protein